MLNITKKEKATLIIVVIHFYLYICNHINFLIISYGAN